MLALGSRTTKRLTKLGWHGNFDNMCLTNSCWNYWTCSTCLGHKTCYKCGQSGKTWCVMWPWSGSGKGDWVPNAAFCPVRLDVTVILPGARPFPHVFGSGRGISLHVGTPCTVALWRTTVPLLPGHKSSRHGG